MKLIGHHPFAVAFIAALLAVAYFVVQEVREDPGQGGFAGFGPAPVEVIQAERREFVDTVEALGTTRANESVEITAKVTETVQRLNFEDGDRVEEGTILAELSHGEETAQLAEARAVFEETQKQYERIANLVERGNASQSQLDTQRAAMDEAQARIEAIEARLADRVIRAPFGGRLGLRQVSPGTLVTPGTVITTLDDISVLKLDFTVPEVYVDTIEPGQQVIASAAAYPDQSFEGVVTTVNTRIDPVTRAATVRARLPNPEDKLRPGMLMTVEVTRERAFALALPEAAVTNVGNRQFVYVVADDGTAHQRTVQTGRRRPGYVEIVDGLTAGETVVVEGHDNLRDGQEVRIVGGAGGEEQDAVPEAATPGNDAARG